MRELKFRVWDKENNCFFKPTYEAYKGKLEDLSIDLSGDLAMHTYDTPFIHESVFPNRFVIQQYTGLKDIKGKEIYEGDVLRMISSFSLRKSVDIGEVEWLEKLYSYGCVDWTFSEIANNISDGEQEIEAIGNIFENSELLQTGGLTK